MKVKGADLHEGQQNVVQLIQGPAKYVTCVAPRQTGKSFIAQQVALYWALNNPNWRIFWVSPTYAQARKPFEEIYDGIHHANVVESANKSSMEMKFKNGAIIYFKSIERADNLRGFTANAMICDEAAYYPEEVWSQILKPIVLVAGKTTLFISTPRGNNFFKKMYDMGLSKDHPEYASCRMTYQQNPFIDQSEIDEARRTLPEHIFKAEYEGSFVDSGSTVFTGLDECTFSRWPQANGRIYMGVDLGRANDYTVCTVIDDAGQVLEIYRDNQKEWSEMIQNIVNLAKKWNAQVLVEANSIGDIVVEQVKKQWSRTEPFHTTSQSKQQIIEALIVAFNRQEVKIPSSELFQPLRFELDIFEYNYSSKSRTVQYSAPQSFHDDCVMSLAIANKARQAMKHSGQYVSMNATRR